MKKQLLLTSLVAMAATAAFAQGDINFKTSVTKNPFYYSTDGSTIAGLIPSTGVIPGAGGGTVTFEFLTAPTTATALTLAQLQAVATGGAAPSGWTLSTPSATATFSGAGVVNATTETLPASAGGPTAATLLEVIAYVGTLSGNGSPASYVGYSGNVFGGSTSVTFNAVTTSTGALDWTQPTGDPNNTLSTPGTVPFGSTGMGSIVLVPTPEPSTIALGGLGVAALLAFRRRK